MRVMKLKEIENIILDVKSFLHGSRMKYRRKIQFPNDDIRYDV